MGWTHLEQDSCTCRWRAGGQTVFAASWSVCFSADKKKSQSWTKLKNRIKLQPFLPQKICPLMPFFPPNKSHLEHWERTLKLIKKAKVFQLCSTASSEPSTSLFQPSTSALRSWVVKASGGISDMPINSPAGTRNRLNLTGKTIFCLRSLWCLNTLMCP